MDKELLIEYLLLRQEQDADLDPYYELVSDISLAGTIAKTNDFINKALGLDEPTEELIMDFLWSNQSRLSYKGKTYEIETIAELADVILGK